MVAEGLLAEHNDTMRILLVDDDEMTHHLVSAVIRVLGDITTDQAFTAEEAFALAQKHPPDLIISDINMPEMDGLALTRRVRGNPALAQTPILLLTARDQTQDKYEGFLHGADDYLTKPFDIMELQLRIKALLRRSPRSLVESPVAVLASALGAGPISLSSARLTATVAGIEIRFTASEFAILRHLVEHPDQLVSPEMLLVEALDYPPRLGNPQTIHSHMRNLRAKFRHAGAEPSFLTSSHQGYLLSTS